MADLYEVRLTANKGYGVFATRNIEAGTVILTDSRIMCIQGDWWNTQSETEHDCVMGAFSNLSSDDQAQYLRLYACPEKSAGESVVRQIFDTNCFGTSSPKDDATHSH